MNNFKKNRFGGDRGGDRFAPRAPRGDFGRPSFGGNRGGFGRPAGRDFGAPELHDAVCADCGKPCQVPFRPNGKKPVYCKECFDRNGGADASGRATTARPAAPREFSAVAKPFKAPAPTYTPAPVADKRIDDLKLQLDAVNAKLDKLMGMIGKPAAEVVEKHVAKKATKKK
jgi:CxxC-x17-CxxC domain-containing protein